MKQMLFFGLAVLTVSVFSFFSSSKKAAVAAAPATNCETNVAKLVTACCSPCYIPAKGGNKLALKTNSAVRDNIDAVIARIEKNPGDKGFVLFKNDKLSGGMIAVLKERKADGLTVK